jgi:hypothetical protein
MGVQGSSKVSVGPPISCYSMLCSPSNPGQPNGGPGVGHPQDEFSILVFGSPLDPSLDTVLDRGFSVWIILH